MRPRKPAAAAEATATSPDKVNGTTLSKRQKRAVSALIDGPVWRIDLDRIAGCTNSPDLVSRLNAKGFEIECIEYSVRDRDGLRVQAGKYFLRATPDGIEL